MPRTFDRTCACCGAAFTGPRLEDRCPECKAKGRRPVVHFKQAPTEGVAAVEHAKRQKAEERKAKQAAKKAEQAAKRKARAEELHRLRAEREALAAEAEAQRLSADAPDPIDLDELEDPEARSQRRRKERCQAQVEWLNSRSYIPRGTKQMKAHTAATDLGRLWQDLCHADGQVNCMTRATHIAPEVRLALTTAHLRLRMAGHTAASVGRVCPVAILEDTGCELAAALKALPKTEDPTPTEDQERQRLKALLGL